MSKDTLDFHKAMALIDLEEAMARALRESIGTPMEIEHAEAAAKICDARASALYQIME